MAAGVAVAARAEVGAGAEVTAGAAGGLGAAVGVDTLGAHPASTMPAVISRATTNQFTLFPKCRDPLQIRTVSSYHLNKETGLSGLGRPGEIGSLERRCY